MAFVPIIGALANVAVSTLCADYSAFASITGKAVFETRGRGVLMLRACVANSIANRNAAVLSNRTELTSRLGYLSCVGVIAAGTTNRAVFNARVQRVVLACLTVAAYIASIRSKFPTPTARACVNR